MRSMVKPRGRIVTHGEINFYDEYLLVLDNFLVLDNVYEQYVDLSALVSFLSALVSFLSMG